MSLITLYYSAMPEYFRHAARITPSRVRCASARWRYARAPFEWRQRLRAACREEWYKMRSAMRRCCARP